MHTVRISAKSLRQEFAGCRPDYIRDVCHASCCRSSTSATGIVVTIHRSEQNAMRDIGAVIVNGLLQPRPGERRCPYQNPAHLCDLHGTDHKPFGCIASPFTLTRTGQTMVVRNRYRLLKCYRDGDCLPAYVAFRASLDLLLGADQADDLCAHLDFGGGDYWAQMHDDTWGMLVDNDATKKGHP